MCGGVILYYEGVLYVGLFVGCGGWFFGGGVW